MSRIFLPQIKQLKISFDHSNAIIQKVYTFMAAILNFINFDNGAHTFFLRQLFMEGTPNHIFPENTIITRGHNFSTLASLKNLILMD